MGNRMNMNERELDEKLAQTQSIAGVVRSLPEETLSMAWRSSLNERVLVEAAKRQRSRHIAWIWRPAVGLALASSLAMAILWKSAPIEHRQPVSVSIEASLLDLHRESVVASEVAGQGSVGTVEEAPKVEFTNPWTEDDLNSL